MPPFESVLLCDNGPHWRHARVEWADMWVVNGEEQQPELTLRGFSYLERTVLLPELGVCIDQAGGWVLERRTIDANAMELVMEVQTLALLDVYGALLAGGMELTRDSHRSLAQQCSCSFLLPRQRGAAAIVLLRVEIQFVSASAGFWNTKSQALPGRAMA